MNIERFEIPGLAQYAYMVADGGEAIVIDPIRDYARYTAFAAAHGWRITHVLETHIHADYASGASALAQATGAELALSAYDADETFIATMPHRDLHDGDVIEIGHLQIKALHTPGHTPEHLSFLLYETSRSTTIPVAMFSGDFLFVGSLGRPDLLGDEAKVGLAHELYTSVHQRIAALPDGLIVYPGHGAGSLCGAGLSDRPESTLGYERATNPYFGMGEEEFVRSILDAAPEMPVYYPRMKALNAAGATDFSSLREPAELTPLQAEMLIQKNATIIDLRRPEAFGGAHIPGSINIGIGGNISMWAGWLLDPAAQLVLVGDAADTVAARAALARVGLDNVVGTLDIAAWIGEGRPFHRIAQRHAAEVEAAVQRGEVALLDVRSPGEVLARSLPGAQTISLGELPASLDRLERARPLVVVCGSGYRSSIAASLLERAGFEGVSSLHGGMGAWNARTGSAAGPSCSSGNRT